MGRFAKRVPLDFAWPIDKVWSGYEMPDRLSGARCADCDLGLTAEGAWLQKLGYVLAGLADDFEDAQRDRHMHPYLTGLRDISYGGSKFDRPGEKFGELVDGLAEDPAHAGGSIFGRDVHAAARSLRAAAGLPDDWGICPTCKGEGQVEVYPGQSAEADAWEPTEPPVGDGWQMWSNTGDPCPTSPVFITPEELADWCESNDTIYGHYTAPSSKWLSIILGDDAASVEIAPGVIVM